MAHGNAHEPVEVEIKLLVPMEARTTLENALAHLVPDASESAPQ